MRERNTRILRDRGVAPDSILLSARPDTRKGVGLFSFIDQSLAIEELLATVRQSFPAQICYSLSPTPGDNFGRIHFTFFQFIKVGSIPADFSENNMKSYIDIARSVLSSMKPITITFKGVMAIPTGLLIYGYPSYDLNPFREQLREELTQQQVTYVEPYKNDIVHSTIMRIASPINSEKLIAFAETYNEKELFTIEVSNLQLGYGSWTMRDEEVRMVEMFNL